MWVCRAICFLFMSCVCLPSPFLLHSGLFDQFQNFGVIYQRLAAPLYRLLVFSPAAALGLEHNPQPLGARGIPIVRPRDPGLCGGRGCPCRPPSSRPHLWQASLCSPCEPHNQYYLASDRHVCLTRKKRLFYISPRHLPSPASPALDT